MDAFAATVQAASETPIGLTYFLRTLRGALLNGLVSSCHTVLVRLWSSSLWYFIMYSMLFIWFSSNFLGSLKLFFFWRGMADMADTDIDSERWLFEDNLYNLLLSQEGHSESSGQPHFAAFKQRRACNAVSDGRQH